MTSRGLFASFGASSGFSGAAFWEWCKTPTAMSAIAFVGSVASTLISYELARWNETRRADVERRRELWHLERLAKLSELARDSKLTVAELQALDDLDGPHSPPTTRP